MTDLDTRYVLFAVWGGGTVLVYGRVLYIRMVSYWRHRDTRARREVIAALALFITALCSAVAITFALFGATGPRSVIVSFSLGAFLAAGITLATERKPRDRGRRSGD